MEKTTDRTTCDPMQEKIRTSGTTILPRNLCCAELLCQGATKCPGNVTVRGQARFSGSAIVCGDFICTALRSEGSFHAMGQLGAEEIVSSGNFLCDGVLLADSVQSYGSFCAKQAVRAHSITAQGSFCAGGEIVVKELLKLNMSACVQLGNITAKTVILEPQRSAKRRLILMERVFAREMAPIFNVDDIIADTVQLSFAKTGVIRANRVEIGQNTVVDRVFYSDTLLIDPSSTVKEAHRVSPEDTMEVG